MGKLNFDCRLSIPSAKNNRKCLSINLGLDNFQSAGEGGGHGHHVFPNSRSQVEVAAADGGGHFKKYLAKLPLKQALKLRCVHVFDMHGKG